MSEVKRNGQSICFKYYRPDRRKQLRVASNAGTCTLIKTLLFKQSDQQMHSYVRVKRNVQSICSICYFPRQT